jgi:hypothetical protein
VRLDLRELGLIADDGAPVQRRRFARVSAVDLAKPVPPMEWLIRNVWPRHSFGPMGGEKKTLKSYNLLSMSVAVASGEAMFGEFEVVSQGPVLFYVGEGGQGPFQRRLQAIASANKVELADLPIEAVFEVGSLAGQEFTESLKRNLDEMQPELVIIDPLYAFHPPGIEAQNLYERGRMLAELGAAVGGEAALIVADHFKKTGGSDLDLDSISQAGMGQWADSWILQKHREKPDLIAGEYRLAVEFGSRQWGGGRWDLDWHLPTVGQLEAGEGTSELSWSVRQSDGNRERPTGAAHMGSVVEQILSDDPFTLTKTALINAVGGKKETARKVVDQMLTEGQIVVKGCPKQEGGRSVKRQVLGLRDRSIKIRL